MVRKYTIVSTDKDRLSQELKQCKWDLNKKCETLQKALDE